MKRKKTLCITERCFHNHCLESTGCVNLTNICAQKVRSGFDLATATVLAEKTPEHDGHRPSYTNVKLGKS